MYDIYLNNIRGFNNQIIHIKEVNFLVGENSTGKTSLLSILNLMASPEFWIESSFNNNNVKLGSFDEIINQHTKNKNYFSIGYNRETQKKQRFKLMTYKNNEGSPAIHKLSLLHEDKILTISIKNREIYYKIHEIDPTSLSTNELFSICENEHLSKETTEYTCIDKIPLPTLFLSFQAEKIVKTIISNNTGTTPEAKLDFSLQIELPELVWISPIRATPQRTYESYKESPTPDGKHIPQLINTYIAKSKKSGKQSKVITAINEFGNNSGLYDEIDTKRYGDDSSSPFELDVLKNNSRSKICNVGYGISQVLPIITEIEARSGTPMFAIQQPEVHLHPKAQAAIGNFIYDNAKNKKKFIIETHSDYLIDRFRLNINKHGHIKSQVLFFEKSSESNLVHEIEICNDGSYSYDQPDSFREFFINEEMDLLRI